ncbi:MAG: hypothetical protein UX68_C0041G0005 [Parcubacteria group bacterium GW2011_GWA2_46_9]|nr:MAG: hypothetical protein UX68_C0041G0005 [Parcubacteria group bacterium GW2011_GWA2_46_9]
MNKLKQYWTIILVVLIFSGGLFYWFQWRPSSIRRECSWVQRHINAVQAQPAIPPKSQQELLAAYQKCKNDKGYLCEMWYRLDHSSSGRPEIKAEPAKDWWESASPSEYSSCLHSKGL